MYVTGLENISDRGCTKIPIYRLDSVLFCTWPLDGNEYFSPDCGNVTDVVCPLFCFLSLEERDLSC